MQQEYYHKHISAKHILFDLKLGEIMKYRDLIFLFTKRSFTVQYKQTILGPLWLFISPLMTAVMHMILFGNIAKLGTNGVPQLLFYFSGTAIWEYYERCFSRNSTVFTRNAYLFGKVYFPRLTMPISYILTSVIRFGIQMIVAVVLMVYYTVTGQITLYPVRWLLIPVILLWLGLLGLGLGIIISSLTTKYWDLSILVGFGVSLWMYATPVVYPLSTMNIIPKAMQIVVRYNPVTMPVELFRICLFGVGQFDSVSAAFSILVTIVSLLLGIMIFNKVERTFMDTV